MTDDSCRALLENNFPKKFGINKERGFGEDVERIETIINRHVTILVGWGSGIAPDILLNRHSIVLLLHYARDVFDRMASVS